MNKDYQNDKIEMTDLSENSPRVIDMEFDIDEQLLERLRKICPTLYGMCEECQQPNTDESWFSKAIWTDGPIVKWDIKKGEWKRIGAQPVIFKRLNNSKIISQKFLDEVKIYQNVILIA
ncbi:4104_t:CDS:2 [Cetraspora pellucida]|uniref:4104_t:CDS:1 n=1 Tax=Cetraspora pellucida TaxID=1433469 RepID=A0A9N9NXM5_9GLOM|nr:4104_t:CDS:2 [Cetraspora pellucida]